MKALEGSNNVKVYNLSAGKSLPDWLTDRKKRKLSKKDSDFRHRIELIQDFSMPDVSSCVKVSPNGQFILAAGTYKPRIKCFEVSALSLKFERCLDAEVINFSVLSEDYSKLVFLQEDRFVEFHNQGGRWFRTRIPKFGRDLAYHFPSCDLYIAGSGSEIYRLNLNQGHFLNSLQTSSLSNNKCAFNPSHYLFCCGTEDGRVEAWDPRSRQRVGILDCALYMTREDVCFSSYTSAKQLGVTALTFKDGLTMGVGTQTGQVLLYDIRSHKPLLVKDHVDGFPIKNVVFHQSSGMVLSLSCSTLKIWENDTGKPHTSIESDIVFNDFTIIPESGMIFLATESPKMHTYFLPSLGPAPKWCGHLDALIEELEEEEMSSTYDDYKFVTEEELKLLGLEDLIGTNVLRAVMHGYYIHTKLYNKARLIANPFNYEDFINNKVKQKISEQNQRKIVTTKLPSVNSELYSRLIEEDSTSKKPQLAKTTLQDDRFSSLFSNQDFTVDKESEEYRLVQPLLTKIKTNQKKIDEEREEEEEYLESMGQNEKDFSSDSDSILSANSDSDSEEEQEKEIKSRKAQRKFHPTEFSPRKINTKDDSISEKIFTKRICVDSAPMTSADTLSELNERNSEVAKLSLASRLEKEEMESTSESAVDHAFGNREMQISFKSDSKYEKLRQKQKEHHDHRKRVQRKANFRGKIRMNF